MPPVRKTYRPSRSISNNSVDAFNALFAKNLTKRLIDKKKKKIIFQKELPARVETILYNDSLQISTDDTFDKLRKGPVYNMVSLGNSSTNSISKQHFSEQKNKSSSFKNNSNFSPKLTRQRSKMLTSSVETLNKTDSLDYKFKEPTTSSFKNHQNFSPKFTGQKSKLSNSSLKTPNRTDSLEERLREPTVSKLNSLEIEVESKYLLSRTKECFSFIKIPSKVNNPHDISRSFTNLLPYTSTPVVTPCKVSSLLKKSMEEIQKWDHKFPVDANSERSNFLPRNKSYSQLRESSNYINLRRRKVLKNSNTDATYEQSDMSHRSRMVVSLEAFNTFENSTNNPQSNSKAYNLNDFESFMQEISTRPENKLEARVNFVTGRCKSRQYRFLQNSIHHKAINVEKARRHSMSSICDESNFYKDYLVHLSKVNHESLVNYAISRDNLIESNKKLMIKIPKLAMMEEQLKLRKFHSLNQLYSKYNSKLDEVGYQEEPVNPKNLIKMTKDANQFEDFFLENFPGLRSSQFSSSTVNDSDSLKDTQNHPDLIVKITKDANHFETFFTQNYSLYESCDNISQKHDSRDLSKIYKDVNVLLTKDEKKFEEFFMQNMSDKVHIESTVESHLCDTSLSQNKEVAGNLVVNVTNHNLKNYMSSGINDSTFHDGSIDNTDSTVHDGSINNTEYEPSVNEIPSICEEVINCDIKNTEIKIDELDIGEPLIQKVDSSNPSSHLRMLPTSPSKTIIDLTDSSDVIESSLMDSSQIERDYQFVKPRKTLLLKPGKLWRRSLLMYRRSNAPQQASIDGTCTSKIEKCSCPKSNLADRRLRRSSIRIVPVESPKKSNKTLLEEYAVKRTSYVPDQVVQENLENSFRDLSLIEEKSSILDESSPVTAQEIVLKKCGQVEPIQFTTCYPESILHHCHKIGEGVYGEVFLFKNPNGGTSVIKIIPIEGDQIVNGERQKTFDEVLSEIIIATELSNLRIHIDNSTTTFNEVQQIKCLQGRYPERLLELWDLFDENQTSENDCPDIFKDDQLYIVLQLTNGGRDLESYLFHNAAQTYAMFEQVAFALAVAERQLNFEHRDLHWGNVLLANVDKNKTVTYTIDGKSYEVLTKGVEATIIDFTLSRVEYDGVVLYNDLSMDEELFTGDGDYQFEIYRLMQQRNGNNWQRFEPYSNLLWLHYILDKAVSALNYEQRCTKTAIHKKYTAKLKQMCKDILKYKNTTDFVLNYLV